MSVFRNLSRTSHKILWYDVPKNSSFHTLGIIPGGGLGKLQGIKEETYFSRQDHKLFENLKNIQKTKFDYTVYRPNIDKYLSPSDRACSVKHKNLTEEVYFLNDHCECLKLLGAKFYDTNAED